MHNQLQMLINFIICNLHKLIKRTKEASKTGIRLRYHFDVLFGYHMIGTGEE